MGGIHQSNADSTAFDFLFSKTLAPNSFISSFPAFFACLFVPGDLGRTILTYSVTMLAVEQLNIWQFLQGSGAHFQPDTSTSLGG